MSICKFGKGNEKFVVCQYQVLWGGKKTEDQLNHLKGKQIENNNKKTPENIKGCIPVFLHKQTITLNMKCIIILMVVYAEILEKILHEC